MNADFTLYIRHQTGPGEQKWFPNPQYAQGFIDALFANGALSTGDYQHLSREIEKREEAELTQRHEHDHA